MRGKSVDTNGAQIFTESVGDPAHPPVLLLMGACASGVWWPEAFCGALAARGRFVIRYDHRDTGRSTQDPPGEPSYTLADLADDPLRILDAYGLASAHLVGMSLGGILAQMIALDHPDRVRTLTLLASAPLAPADPSTPPMDPRVAAYYARGSTLDWSDTESAKAYSVEGWRVIAGTAHPFDEAHIRSLAEEDFARTPDMKATLNHGWLEGGDGWSGRLHELRAPVLVIHGTDDPVLPYGPAASLLGLLPGTTLCTLHGAGHELHPDDWPIILDAIASHTVA